MDEPWHRDVRPLLERALLHAEGWWESLEERPVAAAASPAEMVAAFDEPLPYEPTSASDVVDLLARRAEPGLAAVGSGRFFGFVIGGVVPASLAADWLAVAWDQNAGLREVTPAAAVVEEVAGRWVVDLLGLPSGSSVGFVTGGCVANFTCLAAARHHVLAAHGWDVERDGLQGAPTVRVLTSDQRHATIDLALRYLGLGSGQVVHVATDDQGRMDPAALRRALSDSTGPTIVCLAAGNVNTGSFDDFTTTVAAAHEHGAWVHVDGAFGLWAAASPATAHLTAGMSGADSWSTDGHKWLNVPYDSGLAVVAHPAAHRGAFAIQAEYLVQGAAPDPMDLVPEFSRRARGFAVWAALRSLGRQGVVELGDRMCGHARRLAGKLGAMDGVAIVNDVVLNQVLVRFDDDDATTLDVVGRVTASGRAYLSPSLFKGRRVMRISVCNGWTTEDDVDRTVEAVADALGEARAARR
jgi:glutamate/tyrosine decarboxylase-like PLP-dependent enzyme